MSIASGSSVPVNEWMVDGDARSIDALAIRRALGRKLYRPPQRFAGCGWSFVQHDRRGSVIVSVFVLDGIDWLHASIAHQDSTPTYDELVRLHRAVFGNGWSYQVFSPPSDHINIHEHALHLWGRADGQPVLPNFGFDGTI